MIISSAWNSITLSSYNYQSLCDKKVFADEGFSQQCKHTIQQLLLSISQI